MTGGALVSQNAQLLCILTIKDFGRSRKQKVSNIFLNKRHFQLTGEYKMTDNIFEKLIFRGIVPALEDCYEANCRPAYMPELVRERIVRDLSDDIWNNWWTSASLLASGQTKQGSHVKIVAHIPHAFIELAALKDVFNNDRLIGGAGEYPEEDFHHKVALAEKGEAGLYLIPEERLERFKSGLYSLDSALEHPLAIPIMGVSESEAEKYLSKHKKKFGSEIGIWYASDSAEKPLGRLVFFGLDYGNFLVGSSYLDDYARLFGVRDAETNSR